MSTFNLINTAFICNLKKSAFCLINDYIVASLYEKQCLVFVPLDALNNKLIDSQDLSRLPNCTIVPIPNNEPITKIVSSEQDGQSRLVTVSRSFVHLLEWSTGNHGTIIISALLENPPKILDAYIEADWLFLASSGFVDCLRLDAQRGLVQIRIAACSSVTCSHAYIDIQSGHMHLAVGGADRTFQLYDIDSRACLYVSPVLCSRPLQFCTVSATMLIFATDDCRLFVFSRGIPRLLKQLNLTRCFRTELRDSSSADSDEQLLNSKLELVCLDSSRPQFSSASIAEPAGEELVNNIFDEMWLQIAKLAVFEDALVICTDMAIFAISLDSLKLCFARKWALAENGETVGSRVLTISDHGAVEQGLNELPVFQPPLSDVELLQDSPGNLQLLLISALSRSCSILALQRSFGNCFDEPQNVQDIKDLPGFVDALCSCTNKGESGWKAQYAQSILASLHKHKIMSLQQLVSERDAALLCFPYFTRPFANSILQRLREIDTVNLYFNPADNVKCHPKSPLKILCKEPVKAAKQQPKKQTTKSLDKPITFRKTIQSSGYTKPLAFSSLARNKPLAKKAQKDSAISLTTEPLKQCWSAAAPEFQIKHNMRLEPQNGAVVSVLQAAKDKRTIYTAATDGSIQMQTVGAGNTCKLWRGHSLGITSLNLTRTNENTLLLSSSLDGTVKMWSANYSEPLLSVSPKQRYVKSGITSASFVEKAPVFLLATESKLEFYRYDLDQSAKYFNTNRTPSAASPIKPNLAEKRHKCAKTFEFDFLNTDPPSQSITALAPAKTSSSVPRSVFVATSNKMRSLAVFDIVSCQVSREWALSDDEMATSRSIYHIYAEPDSSLIYTMSINEGIQGWDVRCFNHNRPVFTLLGGHLNKSSSLLQCSKPLNEPFLVCGSEDGTIPIYDLRSRRLLKKLAGPKVTSLAATTAVLACSIRSEACIISGSLNGNLNTLLF